MTPPPQPVEIVIRLRLELPPGMTLAPLAAPEPRDAYRVPEVAERLGVGVTVVRELIAKGDLDSVMIANCRCVTAHAIRAYLAGLSESGNAA